MRLNIMQNKQDKRTVSLIIIFLAITQLVFMLIIITAITNRIAKKPTIIAPKSQPAVNIDNISIDEIDLADTYTDRIKRILTDAIITNTPSFDIPSTKVKIRENTITTREFATANLKAISFIVDIPNLEQSYQIYFNYYIGPDANSFSYEDADAPYIDNLHSALCLDDESQIIYPNFDCHSIYPNDARYQIAQSYIKLLKFNTFSVAIDSDNPHQINLFRYTRIIDTLNESHIAEVKQAISSLGISPELFVYHIAN